MGTKPSRSHISWYRRELGRAGLAGLGVAIVLSASAVGVAGSSAPPATPPPAEPTTTAESAPVPDVTAPTTPPIVDAAAVATVAGNAVCDPASSRTTITWRVVNLRDIPIDIVSSSRETVFDVTTLQPAQMATGTNEIDGPDADTSVTNAVTVAADGIDVTLSATAIVAACHGPAVPAEVDFTFDITASVTTAAIGDTVEYVYCGRNLSDIELEVVKLVDDRLDVLLELPETATIVPPGATICNTDIGLDVSYEVTPSDAGQTIVNNAHCSSGSPMRVRRSPTTPPRSCRRSTAGSSMPPIRPRSRCRHRFRRPARAAATGPSLPLSSRPPAQR